MNSFGAQGAQYSERAILSPVAIPTFDGRGKFQFLEEERVHFVKGVSPRDGNVSGIMYPIMERRKGKREETRKQ